MEEVKSFGSVAAFYVSIGWRDDYGSDGPIGKTWGELQLWVGNTPVWGQRDNAGRTEGITWSWIELLEFLANAWPYLIEEEQYPIVFSRDEEPRHLGQLWGSAKLRLGKLSDDAADQEDEQLRDFLTVHDLSEALQGAFPPKLLCMRRGSQMLVATTRQEFVLSFDETMTTFSQIGDAIYARIVKLTDTRSENARNRWQHRDEKSNLERLKIATRMDEAVLRKVWPSDVESLAANDHAYELKAAARMIIRRLTDDQLKIVLKKIYTLPKGKCLELADLWEKSLDIVLIHEFDEPHAQGYFLALMLRNHLQCDVGRVEPEEILRDWGVAIESIAIENSLLDAIAVWSDKHTPTIFLNPNGPRSKQPKGKRSTLAHEICHILVDLKGALPVVEVLGGDVPHSIERRANAFAAEFLLPRSAAGIYVEQALAFVYQQEERNSVINRAINELAEKYGASQETTTWQVINSDRINPTDRVVLQKYLNSVNAPYSAIDPA
jgi:Zn-dependent peptidase ImmA (M78 family)